MQLRPADNARAGTICRLHASTSLRLCASTRSSPPLTSHRASPRASGFVHMLQCAAQVLLCCVISYSTLWRPVPWRLRNNGHRAWGVGISRPCSRAAAEEVGLLPVPLRGWLLSRPTRPWWRRVFLSSYTALVCLVTALRASVGRSWAAVAPGDVAHVAGALRSCVACPMCLRTSPLC